MVRRRAAAAQPAEEVFEEVDELEELDDPEAAGEDDLEELEEEPAPAPTKRATKAAKAAPAKAAPAKAATKRAAAPKAESAESSEFDSNWLASYVTEETGVDYDSRGIRMLLRRLAKDGSFEREIGTDRSRYVFPKGANDPIVRQVVKLVKSGAATTIKREGLETAKASKAAKAAPPAKATAKTTPAKATKTAPAKATTRRRAAQ